MAQNLAPLPQPGLSIYPSYIATKPETFVAKGRDAWSDKASYLVSFATPTGEPGAPFLEIVEIEEEHQLQDNASGKTEYHGMRGDSVKAWGLKLKTGWTGTEYQLTINDAKAVYIHVIVQNKVQGADKGILINGQPATTMKRHEAWKHVHRMDIINVAPGMDILLALGVNWIRQDKQKQDTKTTVAAAT
ncbi:hypothetical protein EK21DRAFT_104801 [Setomelanomma holmii]|uniref:Uncharacterized protein n=1 Tax=Setomelanomma holmii TaxID=210430 RepID=A0A9P4GYW2_9PLEO|nr:hypothetical protein EK21DRAFT_104801 [Setomelanomma holmii]